MGDILKKELKVKHMNLHGQRHATQTRDMITEKARKDISEIAYDNIKHIFWNENTFNDQLQMFLFVVQPTETEIQLRYDVVYKKLTALLRKTVAPKCTLYKFGSLHTGLGLKDCDLDIYVDTGEQIYKNGLIIPKDGFTMQMVLKEVEKALRRRRDIFSQIVAVPKARVPIIKFFYHPNSVSCDLSFTSLLGLYKSELIKFYISLDYRVKPLLMLLKYWAWHYKLFGTGQMSSYGLYQLVIFYLQQDSVKILPPVKALSDPSTEKTVNGWPVNFNTSIKLPSITNTSSIPELLNGFFNFYSYMNFELVVICPLDGQIHSRLKFQQANYLPDYMAAYKDILINKTSLHRFQLNSSMCVQDPIELNYNVTAPYSKFMQEKFSDYCKIGASVCATSSGNEYRDLLGNLFNSYSKLDRIRCGLNIPVYPKFIHNVVSPKITKNAEHLKDLKLRSLLLLNLIKDVFERMFKLCVEVRNTININNVNHIKQQNTKFRMEFNCNFIEFQCVGKYFQQWNRVAFRVEPNEDANPLEQMVHLADSFEQKSNERITNDKNLLHFTCSFRQHLKKLHIILENTEHDHRIFQQFATVIKKILPCLIESMMPHMEKYNDSQIICTQT